MMGLGLWYWKGRRFTHCSIGKAKEDSIFSGIGRERDSTGAIWAKIVLKAYASGKMPETGAKMGVLASIDRGFLLLWTSFSPLTGFFVPDLSSLTAFFTLP